MKFKNPNNGYTEELTDWCYLWSFLFGGIYLMVKGAPMWGVAAILCAFFTYGISFFVFPFFTKTILRQAYLRKGWIELDDTNEHRRQD